MRYEGPNGSNQPLILTLPLLTSCREEEGHRVAHGAHFGPGIGWVAGLRRGLRVHSYRLPPRIPYPRSFDIQYSVSGSA